MTLTTASHSQDSAHLYDSDPELLDVLATFDLPRTTAEDNESNRLTRVTDSRATAARPASTHPTEEPTILGKRQRSQSPSEVEYFHDFTTEANDVSASGSKAPAAPFDVYGPSKFGGMDEYMVRKRAKLRNQNAAIAGGDNPVPPLFKGAQIYINGFTNPPLQELRKLIVGYGGVFHAYLDRKSMVTHVVAEQLTPSKWKEYANLKVVTPAWIVDSVKAEKLLPWRNYMLRNVEAKRTDAPLSTNPLASQRPLESTFRPQNRSGTLRADDKIVTDGPERRSVDTAQSTTNHAATYPPANQQPSTVEPAPPVAEKRPSYAPHTSNRHAARLMQDPKWRSENTSAGGAPFVEGFFRKSRLHYLSTWKNELKILVKNARSGKSASTNLPDVAHSMRGSELVMCPASPMKDKSSRSKADEQAERVIMHCDFDSFFVSAGLLRRPELKGRPVAVCHAQGDDNSSVSSVPDAQSTSEIASASYEARAKGVKNGMSLRQAKELCPDIQTIPYDFETYKDISIKFYNVLLAWADDIEVTSVDEAMIDVTLSVTKERLQDPANDPSVRVAERIRNDVRQRTGCEVSIGIGESLLLARIATKKAKPAGSYHLKREDAVDHLAPLPLSILPGFGYNTIEKIKAKWGISTCGEAYNIKEETALQKVLGPGTGLKLWNFVRGIDDRQLKAEELRKSVSATINYAIRFENLEQVRTFLFALGKEVSARMEADSLVGWTCTLSVMVRASDAPIEAPKFLGHGSCDSYSYNSTISGPNGTGTADAGIISVAAWKMMQAHHSNDSSDLRGVGISITSLENADSVAAEKQSKLSFAPKPKPKPALTAPVNLGRVSRERSESVDLTGIDDDGPTTPTKSSKQAPLDIRRITRQLAPPRSTTTSPTKHGLFAKRVQPTVTVTDAELRELDIDPDVYRMLPADIQKEQLNAQRIHVRASRRSAGPNFRDSRSPSRSRSASAAPLPVTTVPGVQVAAQYTAVPALKKAKTADELQDLITKWVSTGAGVGPEPAATGSIRDFLLRCITEQGDLALDKIAAVLKWWRHMCLLRWPVNEESPESGDDVGSLWWAAFVSVKVAVDAAISERFGGVLSLT